MKITVSLQRSNAADPDKGKTSAVIYFLIIVVVWLFLIGFLTFNILNPWPVYAISALMAIPLAALAWSYLGISGRAALLEKDPSTDPKDGKRISLWIWGFLIIGIWMVLASPSYVAIAWANQHFDKSLSATETTKILNKQINRSKSPPADYKLQVKLAGYGQIWLYVSKKYFKSVEIGNPITVIVSSGALGFPYAQVADDME